MDALLELIGVLAALHVALGVHWLRRAAFAFRAWAGARVEAIPGSRPWGSDRMALVLAPPLPGLGELFLVEIFPVSIGSEAVFSFTTEQPNPGGRTPQPARLVRWTEVRGVRADGRNVLVGGSVFAQTSSAAHARHVTRLLERLAALDARAREREIESVLARSLDADAARERVAEFRASVPALRAPAVLTFLLLFGALPAAGATVGLALAWPWLLGALVALQAWSTWAFVRAHRALNPGERGERTAQAISVALSPVEALRTAQVLSRDLLAGFHPLAAAAAMLPRERLEPFASAVLRDALHPLPPVCPSEDPLAVATEREARERRVRALQAAAKRLGLPADLGARAPAAESDERTYCPRCLRTYVLESGTCSECWDLPLARVR